MSRFSSSSVPSALLTITTPTTSPSITMVAPSPPAISFSRSVSRSQRARSPSFTTAIGTSATGSWAGGLDVEGELRQFVRLFLFLVLVAVGRGGRRNNQLLRLALLHLFVAVDLLEGIGEVVHLLRRL